MNVVAAREIKLAVNFRDLLRLPGHADILHPVNGGVGVIHQTVGQNRIDTTLRDAIEIVDEILTRVGRDLHALESLLRHLREKSAQLLWTGMHEAEADVGELRIATGFLLRRFLQHDDALGAGLFRGDRSFERGAAAPDHDDVAFFFCCHDVLCDGCPYSAMTPMPDWFFTVTP